MISKIFSKKRENKIIVTNELYEIITDLIPDNCKNIPLNAQTKLSSIGFNSLTYINLMLKIEELINKELEEIIETLDITKLETIGDIADFISQNKD